MSPLWRLLELSGPAILLLSPQPLYYDVGICIFSCARYVRLETDRRITGFIFLVAFVSVAVAFRDLFLAQPIFVLLIAVFFYLSHEKTRGI